MVAAEKLHLEQEHSGPAQGVGDEVDPSKDKDEVRAATVPKEFPACRDDRNFLLAPARWLPGPLDWVKAA